MAIEKKQIPTKPNKQSSSRSSINRSARFSTQSVFATSKLIQNLGSNHEQYKFKGNLRDVHGRD